MIPENRSFKMKIKVPNSYLEIIPTIDELFINSENVLKGLGMKYSDADDYLLTLIDQLILQCKKLIEPKACYSIIADPQFYLEKKQIQLQDIFFDTGKVVTNSLRKSENIIVFACTIGAKAEHLAKQLMSEGDSLEGYIVDLVGSEFAESVVDYLHAHLEKKAQEMGQGVSNRFSPGYCHWPVVQQHQLFRLIGSGNCGIVLTPSALMLPVKSVSGIIGMGKGMKRVAYKCKLCDDDKCIMRQRE